MHSTTLYSDGCSWVPDFWFRACCVIHDYGGSDLELAQCIVETAPEGMIVWAIILAVIYFIGLKLFGWIYQLHKKVKEDADNNGL